MEDDLKVTDSASKSKQERIRDNQRRSRARRQEYLADLEKKLSECRVTCREADLQKAAFLDLQIENAHLRELLSTVGVNDEVVENYLIQRTGRREQGSVDNAPSLRTLKPKIPTIAPSRASANIISAASSRPPGTLGSLSSYCSASILHDDPSATSMPSSLAVSSHLVAETARSVNDPNLATSDVSQQSPMSFIGQQSSSERGLQPSLDSFSYTTQCNLSFLCEPFQIQATGPLLQPSESILPCTVAKDLIDQYQVSHEEMENVKLKLASGFYAPAFSGAVCGVDGDLLFQVISELRISDV